MRISVAALRTELSALSAALPDSVAYEVVEGMFDVTLRDVLDRFDADGRLLAPAFVMVDPFGVSGIPLDLMRRLLGNPKCELYITLMKTWINRFRNLREYEAALMELYGDDSWRGLVELPEGDERVLGFLDLYESKLRASGASFVQRFNLYRENAFVYSIFFATNHRLGCARMKNAIWKLDPSGGFEFRGRRAGLDQLALDIGGQPNLRELGRLLTQHLRDNGAVSVSELEEWLGRRRNAVSTRPSPRCAQAARGRRRHRRQCSKSPGKVVPVKTVDCWPAISRRQAPPGIHPDVRPSSMRLPAFGVKPPHLLPKKRHIASAT